MMRIRSFFARLPFTLLMLVGLSIIALATSTYFEQITDAWLNRLGFSPNDLWYWRLERMFTSALVTAGGKVFWEAVFAIAFFVGLAEWMTGWKQTAATFWGVHMLALVLLTLIVTLTVHQLRNFGLESSVMARDVGPSAGYFACLGLVCVRLKPPWHWVSGGILTVFFVITLLIPASAGDSAGLKLSADLAHLLAFPLGWLSGLPGKKRSFCHATNGMGG